jgi:hypothetical protein
MPAILTKENRCNIKTSCKFVDAASKFMFRRGKSTSRNVAPIPALLHKPV